VSAGTIDLHYRYIHLQPVRSEPLLKSRAQGVTTVRALEGAELLLEFDRDQTGAFSRPPRDLPRFARRVGRGDVCIAVTRSSRTEGVLWLTFGTFDETGVKADFVVSPQDGIAWASNIYIVDGARGGLIFVGLWDGADAVLRERGYRWTASQTSAFNGPSLQSHERLGALPIGRILYALIGPLQITLSSLRPHWHVASPSGRGPSFVIRPPADASTEKAAEPEGRR